MRCKAAVKFTPNLDRAILRKLVQGATLQQVARRFDLTIAEVKSYRQHICRKLRLNRPAVREYSRAVGLVPHKKAS
jgi:DNA-binding NarL/FixJ family response regulator